MSFQETTQLHKTPSSHTGSLPLIQRSSSRRNLSMSATNFALQNHSAPSSSSNDSYQGSTEAPLPEVDETFHDSLPPEAFLSDQQRFELEKFKSFLGLSTSDEIHEKSNGHSNGENNDSYHVLNIDTASTESIFKILDDLAAHSPHTEDTNENSPLDESEPLLGAKSAKISRWPKYTARGLSIALASSLVWPLSKNAEAFFESSSEWHDALSWIGGFSSALLIEQALEGPLQNFLIHMSQWKTLSLSQKAEIIFGGALFAGAMVGSIPSSLPILFAIQQYIQHANALNGMTQTATWVLSGTFGLTALNYLANNQKISSRLPSPHLGQPLAVIREKQKNGSLSEQLLLDLLLTSLQGAHLAPQSPRFKTALFKIADILNPDYTKKNLATFAFSLSGTLALSAATADSLKIDLYQTTPWSLSALRWKGLSFWSALCMAPLTTPRIRAGLEWTLSELGKPLAALMLKILLALPEGHIHVHPSWIQFFNPEHYSFAYLAGKLVKNSMIAGILSTPVLSLLHQIAESRAHSELPVGLLEALSDVAPVMFALMHLSLAPLVSGWINAPIGWIQRKIQPQLKSSLAWKQKLSLAKTWADYMSAFNNDNLTLEQKSHLKKDESHYILPSFKLSAAEATQYLDFWKAISPKDKAPPTPHFHSRSRSQDLHLYLQNILNTYRNDQQQQISSVIFPDTHSLSQALSNQKIYSVYIVTLDPNSQLEFNINEKNYALVYTEKRHGFIAALAFRDQDGYAVIDENPQPTVSLAPHKAGFLLHHLGDQKVLVISLIPNATVSSSKQDFATQIKLETPNGFQSATKEKFKQLHSEWQAQLLKKSPRSVQLGLQLSYLKELIQFERKLFMKVNKTPAENTLLELLCGKAPILSHGAPTQATQRFLLALGAGSCALLLNYLPDALKIELSPYSQIRYAEIIPVLNAFQDLLWTAISFAIPYGLYTLMMSQLEILKTLAGLPSSSTEIQNIPAASQAELSEIARQLKKDTVDLMCALEWAAQHSIDEATILLQHLKQAEQFSISTYPQAHIGSQLTARGHDWSSTLSITNTLLPLKGFKEKFDLAHRNQKAQLYGSRLGFAEPLFQFGFILGAGVWGYLKIQEILNTQPDSPTEDIAIQQLIGFSQAVESAKTLAFIGSASYAALQFVASSLSYNPDILFWLLGIGAGMKQLTGIEQYLHNGLIEVKDPGGRATLSIIGSLAPIFFYRKNIAEAIPVVFSRQADLMLAWCLFFGSFYALANIGLLIQTPIPIEIPVLQWTLLAALGLVNLAVGIKNTDKSYQDFAKLFKSSDLTALIKRVEALRKKNPSLDVEEYVRIPKLDKNLATGLLWGLFCEAPVTLMSWGLSAAAVIANFGSVFWLVGTRWGAPLPIAILCATAACVGAYSLNKKDTDRFAEWTLAQFDHRLEIGPSTHGASGFFKRMYKDLFKELIEHPRRIPVMIGGLMLSALAASAGAAFAEQGWHNVQDRLSIPSVLDEPLKIFTVLASFLLLFTTKGPASIEALESFYTKVIKSIGFTLPASARSTHTTDLLPLARAISETIQIDDHRKHFYNRLKPALNDRNLDAALKLYECHLKILSIFEKLSTLPDRYTRQLNVITDLIKRATPEVNDVNDEQILNLLKQATRYYHEFVWDKINQNETFLNEYQTLLNNNITLPLEDTAPTHAIPFASSSPSNLSQQSVPLLEDSPPATPSKNQPNESLIEDEIKSAPQTPSTPLITSDPMLSPSIESIGGTPWNSSASNTLNPDASPNFSLEGKTALNLWDIWEKMCDIEERFNQQNSRLSSLRKNAMTCLTYFTGDTVPEKASIVSLGHI